MKKPSEIFEGKNSSLRKTYEKATQQTWQERFDILWKGIAGYTAIDGRDTGEIVQSFIS